MSRKSPTWWKKADHGQPGPKDPRWNTDPAAIHDYIHIQRRRAWVLWKQTNSPHYETPPVGLVVKPLDTYAHVIAFIPWENNNGTADRSLTKYSDLKPRPHVSGEPRVGQGVQYPTTFAYPTR